MSSINYKELFEYYDGKDQMPEGSFKISPSGVEKFFSDKVTWYSENLLGLPKRFTGSTATVLGTCVHACAEVVANSIMNKEPHNSAELSEAIETYIASYEDDEAYDTDKIRGLWHSMAEPLIRDYVVEANTIATEDYIQYELLPGIYVGGTYDAITSTAPNDNILKPVGELTVRDYKTASKLPSVFTYAYKLQAYTYAYILHQKGIKVSYVELCYAVQPTKTLGVRTKNFVIPFDDQAYDFIEGILYLIADSVQAFKALPEWRYLLMGDYRKKIT